ncbi:MAG: DUF2892 domain-containing protein [Flavobacterium sp.]|nr:DUF2892 domain-containing protein [Flavobacterium sp.]
MPYFQKSSGKKKSIIPGVDINVGKWERIAMVAAGSYLLYRALTANKKNVPESIAGGTMLLRGISGYCPAYAALSSEGKSSSSNVNIRTSMTINRPVYEVYDYWRNLENLPTFMSHLDKVNEIDNITSEWRAKGPAGIGRISWKAQILMDEENRMLSWQSLPDSTIHNAGKVVFKENGANSTELDVTISYHAPLGKAGEAAAKMLNPLFEGIVEDDINSFKEFMEKGQPQV